MKSITQEDIYKYNVMKRGPNDYRDFVEVDMLREVVKGLKVEFCKGFNHLDNLDVAEFCPTKYPNQIENDRMAMAYLSCKAVIKECSNCKKINEAFVGVIQ
jgi:hypothetical protein